MALDRRDWLRATAAMALVPTGALRRLDVAPWSVELVALRSTTLAVSDLDRSVAFYRDLFGPAVLHRTSDEAVLAIGEGPAYLRLRTAGSEPIRIDGFGMAVRDFDAAGVRDDLLGAGLRTAAGERPGALEVSVGERLGVPLVRFGDPHGMVVELVPMDDCGAAAGGCGAPLLAATAASLRLTGISHFTCNAMDPDAANRFYAERFALGIQAHQGAAPLLGVGAGPDFLMFIEGTLGRTPAEAAREPGRVHHACFAITDFAVERVQQALEAHGIRPRAAAGAGALRHWVSIRMPDRGGAPEGTPELYFSDPDGLPIQLQDASYCGGSGVLGDVC